MMPTMFRNLEQRLGDRMPDELRLLAGPCRHEGFESLGGSVVELHADSLHRDRAYRRIRRASEDGATVRCVTEAERGQIELFRRATPQERCELALSLSAATLEWAHRAIERAYPELSPWARRVKFVEIHYGAELARRFERWLVERGLLTE